MRQAWMLVVAMSFFALGGAARAGEETDFETSPVLRAEHCFERSPDEIIAELEKSGWFACEACVDAALSTYADHVRPLVDKRCPGASKVRADLLSALTEFDEAIAGVTGGNWSGHESARREARVEWMIIRAWHDASPSERRKGYVHDDLAAVMLIWYRANVDDGDPAPHLSRDEYARHVHRALAALSKVEKQCKPAQGTELRRQIMMRLAGWLR